MQNKYPLWKNVSLILLTLVGLLYAAPNMYGEDFAIEISPATTGEVVVGETLKSQVTDLLSANRIDSKRMELLSGKLLIRFQTGENQLKAKELIKNSLGADYVVASSLAPSTPRWFSFFGAEPMRYGLDLRGGVHFLLEVDIDGVVRRRIEGVDKEFSQGLREARIRYTGMSILKDRGLQTAFRTQADLDRAYGIASTKFRNFQVSKQSYAGEYRLSITISPNELNNIRQYTIEQTMTTLRNRINELGVGESVVQQQGANRIAVDLPGIQDAGRAKQILGGTATLEFRLVDDAHDARSLAPGTAPVGTKLYKLDNEPLLLKNQVLLSGESITSAVSTVDQQTARPAVQIMLGGGDALFHRATRENVGKRLSIVYVETKTNTQTVDGKVVLNTQKVERVISAPVINEGLGNTFQITGLRDMNEAHNLALLLRAGSLPTTIYYVEERIIGPTLGEENIRRGIVSLEVGLALIMLVMIVYYHVFGLIADIALLLNLVLLVALLSLLGAVLTLPGIAGIVLTLGMAIDANVLIYERIREELRNGATPQAAIYAGYERAFSTIVDANVTTLIVALVLFGIGSGAVRGFAVTLSLGLLTSMLTGIGFTRAIVNYIYGRKAVKKLAIGI